MGKPNTNCLEGFKCPKCGQQDELLLVAEIWVSLTDDGTDDIARSLKGLGGHEWESGSRAMCPKCKYGEDDSNVQVWHFFEEE